MGDSYTKSTLGLRLYRFNSTSVYETGGGFSDDRIVRKSFITSSLTGSKNPNWKEQVRQGINATTFMSGMMFKHEPGNFSGYQHTLWRDISPPNKTRFTSYQLSGTVPVSDNDVPVYTSAPSPLVTSVRNRCIRGFISKADAIRSSVEFGQDVGELKQTLNMILHPMKTLSDSITHYASKLLKAKTRRNRSSLPKILADSYLEWHFGVQPLVSDVAKLIADAERRRFSLYPINVRVTEMYSGSNNPTQIGSLGEYGSINARLKKNARLTGIYAGMIKSGADNSGRIGLAQALQLEPKDWIPTAYDLLPYSWVADYFVNVGDIIRGLCFRTSDIAWGYTVFINEIEHVIIAISHNSSYTVNWATRDIVSNGNTVSGSASYSVKSVVRDRLIASSLIPGVEFSIPVSKYPYYNMAALLTQKFSKLVPFK